MPADENKATIQRLVNEVVNNNALSPQERMLRRDEVFAPHHINHLVQSLYPDEKASTLERMSTIHTVMRTAVPDRHFTIEAMIAEGDKVVIRGTNRGTHSGQVGSVAPTGKKVSWSGVSIVRFVDGKMVEGWHYGDFVPLMQQLGVLPSEAARPSPVPVLAGLANGDSSTFSFGDSSSGD